MKRFLWFFFFLLLLSVNSINKACYKTDILSTDYSTQIGKPLIPWESGQMDICQINTGRGESYFIIFPDSTSMLIDCGEVPLDEYLNPPKPNNSRRAGEWVARFILNVNPRKEKVDYFFNSHLHVDHIGSEVDVAEVISTGEDGFFDYKPTGISLAGEFLEIKKVIDRGYPWYQQPQPAMGNYSHVVNYRKFVEWKRQTTGLTGEMFVVGSNTQFKLNHHPSDFPSFKVQNLFANGQVWTGSGHGITDYVNKNAKNLDKTINENTLSCGIKINYGNFSYYTGGDITGTLLNENNIPIPIESVIKDVIGEVDVCKTNHHAFTGSMLPEFVNAVRAKLYLLPYINSLHLRTDILRNIAGNPNYGDSCLLVSTYLSAGQKESLLTEKFYDQVTETGHAVIRVLNDGDAYLLYILHDEDESKTVKAVYGPFVSKKASLSHKPKTKVTGQISVTNGLLTVTVDEEAFISIYSMIGRECISKKMVTNFFACELNQGLYIVKINEEIHKILVR